MKKTDERHTEWKTTPNIACQIHRKVLNYKIWRGCFSYSSGRSGCFINRVISPSQLEQIKFVSQSQDRSLSQIRSGIQYWKAVGIHVSRINTGINVLPVTRCWVGRRSKDLNYCSFCIVKQYSWYKKCVKRRPTGHLVSGNRYRVDSGTDSTYGNSYRNRVPPNLWHFLEIDSELISQKRSEKSEKGDITRLSTQTDRLKL